MRYNKFNTFLGLFPYQPVASDLETVRERISNIAQRVWNDIERAPNGVTNNPGQYLILGSTNNKPHRAAWNILPENSDEIEVYMRHMVDARKRIALGR